MLDGIEWVIGQVQSIDSVRPGAQELTCLVNDVAKPALAYTDLLGELAVGDRVWLNQRAQSLGLGTGGQALVIAPVTTQPAAPDVHPSRTSAQRQNISTSSSAPNVDKTPARPAGRDHQPPDGDIDSGYLVKARYTPLQVTVRGVDSPHSPHHRVMQQATSLEGMPVVVADLHSSLPAICAGALVDNSAVRIAYVMTDGAALPAAYSRTIHQLRQARMLVSVITAGQAFGGDHEAVSVHSALLAARHVVKAELAVVSQGPGNLGSFTPWGFSGLAVGDAVNAVSILQGKPVGCLRLSGADPRPRHFGLSHHSLTSYGRVALAPADLVMPILTGQLAELGDKIKQSVLELTKPKGQHNLIELPTAPLLEALQELASVGVNLSTMGRGLHEDPAAFLAAAAAGRHAANLL